MLHGRPPRGPSKNFYSEGLATPDDLQREYRSFVSRNAVSWVDFTLSRPSYITESKSGTRRYNDERRERPSTDLEQRVAALQRQLAELTTRSAVPPYLRSIGYVRSEQVPLVRNRI